MIDRTILRFAIAVMLALAAGYFIPAIFAILDGHYFHDDVVELLDDQTRSEHTKRSRAQPCRKGINQPQQQKQDRYASP